MQTKSESSPGHTGNHMKHPGSEEWMEWLYGELSREGEAGLAAHRQICAECRAGVKRWQDAMKALNHWEVTPLRLRTWVLKNYETAGESSTIHCCFALNPGNDELRKVSRRAPTPDGKGDTEAGRMFEDGPNPDLCLTEPGRAEMVRRALLQLSEAFRTVVMLRHYEGLQFRMIGEMLGISDRLAKSRMAEALSQLNQILSRSLNEKETVCKPIAKQRQAIPAIM